MRHMTGTDGLSVAESSVGDMPEATGNGYFAGSPKDFDRAVSIDVPQLFAFLRITQPDAFKKLGMIESAQDINRLKFLTRLSSEIGKRGVIDVLRTGVDHGPLHFDLFYGTPSPGNSKAEALHAKNRFSVTRQLAYTMDETRRALDLCLFINGLPVATFELKNSLTKQTVEDAVEQYRRDRDPRERLFEFGRCVVHFAVDDSEVGMCPELKGKASWFLPFNQGHNDGAGQSAQSERSEDRLPRERGAHADGTSGKSNSIAWLSHQLIGLKRNDKEVFDSVIVVTDRRILDDQIQKTIKQFMQVGATVGHAEHSGDLRRFIEQGKRIIVSTVQKFQLILEEIAMEFGKTFAIVIDEAHSSQGGRHLPP
jgi:type I site-specific restriction-modification system R (restriction) subunit